MGAFNVAFVNVATALDHFEANIFALAITIEPQYQLVSIARLMLYKGIGIVFEQNIMKT